MYPLVDKLEGKYSQFSLEDIALSPENSYACFLKFQSISPLAYKKHKP